MKQHEFYMTFHNIDHMKVGNIIVNDKGHFRILKVYKSNWWKRLVVRFAKWLIRNARIDQVKLTNNLDPSLRE